MIRFMKPQICSPSWKIRYVHTWVRVHVKPLCICGCEEEEHNFVFYLFTPNICTYIATVSKYYVLILFNQD